MCAGGGVQVMRTAGVHDGIAVLGALVDANAIVWGLVDCRGASGTRRAPGFDMMPGLARKAHTVTDDAVRQAMVHLRQLVPPGSDVQQEHAEYERSLRELVSAGVEVPPTMLRALPEELAAKFAAAVSNVRHPLTLQGAVTSRLVLSCHTSAA